MTAVDKRKPSAWWTMTGMSFAYCYAEITAMADSVHCRINLILMQPATKIDR